MAGTLTPECLTKQIGGHASAWQPFKKPLCSLILSRTQAIKTVSKAAIKVLLLQGQSHLKCKMNLKITPVFPKIFPPKNQPPTPFEKKSFAQNMSRNSQYLSLLRRRLHLKFISLHLVCISLLYQVINLLSRLCSLCFKLLL